MLEWLRIWMFWAKSDTNSNSPLAKNLPETQKNYTPIETSTTPKNDAIWAKNMMSPVTWGYSWQFSDTSTLINRQIDDLKSKKTMPKLNFQAGFGWFEGITKPLWATPVNQAWIWEQTQMSNRAPEVKQQIWQDVINQQQIIEQEEQIQSTKWTYEQFWDKIKAKYPEYSDMDSKEVWIKMLQKYPEYWDMVDVKEKLWEMKWISKLMYTPVNEEERKEMPTRWKIVNLWWKWLTQEDLSEKWWTKEDTAASAAFVSELPKMAANIAAFAWDNPLTRKLFWEDFTKEASWKIKDRWEELQKEIYTAMWTTEGIWGFNEQAAEFAAQLLPTLLVPEAKIWEALTQLATKAPLIAKVLTNPLARKTLKNSIASLIGMETFAIASRWENMSPLEAWLALLFPALPVLWAWTKRIWAKTGATNLIKRWVQKFAQKLETSWIINPAKFAQIQEKLLIMWDDWFTKAESSDAAQWLLDRDIRGTKPEIVETLVKRWEQWVSILDNTLKLSTKTYSKTDIPIAENILNKLEQEYSDSMSNVFTERLAKVKEYKTKLTDWTITLKEINEIKQMVWKDLNPYTASGKVKAAQQDLSAATSELKKFVEDQAEKTIQWVEKADIALLNNEISTSYAFAEWIARKEATEFRQELLNMFSSRWGWMILWWLAWSQVWPFDSNTIFWKVWNIIVWSILWWLTSSTKLKTWTANKLNNTFTKKELPILEKYLNMIKDWKLKAVPKEMEIVEKKFQSMIDDANKQLALPSPETVTPSNLWTSTNPIKWIAPKQKDIVELPFNPNKSTDGISNMTTPTSMNNSASAGFLGTDVLKKEPWLSNLWGFKEPATTGLPKSVNSFWFDDMFWKKWVKEITNKADSEIIKQYTKKWLTKSEIEAIQNYSISAEKNVDNKLISQWLKKLDNYDWIVYRWDDFDLTKWKKVWDTIKTDRLMSTELKKNYYDRYQIKYEIKSKNWKNLWDLNNKEREVLFDKWTEFKIDKIIDNKNWTKIIKLSEIY